MLWFLANVNRAAAGQFLISRYVKESHPGGSTNHPHFWRWRLQCNASSRGFLAFFNICGALPVGHHPLPFPATALDWSDLFDVLPRRAVYLPTLLCTAFSTMGATVMRYLRLNLRVLTDSVRLAALAICLPTLTAYAQPAGLVPGDTYHLAFVTSTRSLLSSNTLVPPTNSTLQWGGLGAADWVATWHAQAGNISARNFALSANEFVTGDANLAWDSDGGATHWQAILSDASMPATTRLAIVAPIYNMQGELVANDASDLFDGAIAAPIRYTELGNSISSNFQVWTGTQSNGIWSGASAGAWDDPSGSVLATVGSATNIAAAWTDNGEVPSNQLARLYALSPVFTVPLGGDFNNDGTVNIADYTVWRDNLGAINESSLNGNGSFSGGVDQADYELWRQNFGLRLPTNGVNFQSTPVPEPTTFASCVALGALLLARGCRP